jgi:hypothetical protein
VVSGTDVGVEENDDVSSVAVTAAVDGLMAALDASVERRVTSIIRRPSPVRARDEVGMATGPPVVGTGEEMGEEESSAEETGEAAGRGLHSSTFQLNLSRF